MSTILIICISFLIVFFSSITALAQSSGLAMPNGYIMGYVLDENGNPVPGADVSVWQNGQLWKPQQYGDYSGDDNGNPQTTRITYVNADGFVKEGGFLFDLPYPDEYTITAEKGRYKGSANIHVSQNSSSHIIVNITLDGYYQPTFTPDQLSYNGVIVGDIRDIHGYNNWRYDVSLWRDGHLVIMPNNPQTCGIHNYSGTQVDYIFEHLAPGGYTVMVSYLTYYYNDNVSVDIDTRPMRADILLSREPTVPDPLPDISFTPTVGEFVASTQASLSATALPCTAPRPTPALPGIIVILVIGSTAILLHKNYNRD